MKVTYNGPIDAVEIAATGHVVERGQTVEVPDDLGKSLCEQDIWTEAKPVTAKAGPAPAKKDGE
jgi:hypothetical protein